MPPSSLTASLLPCLAGTCVCVCLFLCVCGQDACNTASDGITPLYQSASPRLSLGAGSREGMLVLLSGIPPASGVLGRTSLHRGFGPSVITAGRECIEHQHTDGHHYRGTTGTAAASRDHSVQEVGEQGAARCGAISRRRQGKICTI